MRWVTFFQNSNASTLLPQGLHFKADITGTDATKWRVVMWLHNGITYPGTDEFRKAWESPKFEKTKTNLDGSWTTLQSELAPGSEDYSTNAPPDCEEGYVSWMGFSFNLAFSRVHGIALYHIHAALSSSIHDHILNFKADIDLPSYTPQLHPHPQYPRRNHHPLLPLVPHPAQHHDLPPLHHPALSRAQLAPQQREHVYVVTGAPNNLGEARRYRMMPGTGVGTPAHPTGREAGASSAMFSSSDRRPYFKRK
ncbi:hypothetical protein B0T25DRAFT_572310 [Lasiosphaeria hispida]|uniref:DUF1965 domain-containing protein n=1 Tax=Lasiosphaeria hispida TaxID=260671 RepID=A0AAJ0MBT6_9PEZI|nr:hypothetical protein B0T25DRAFT_572310 [Lasiosphaeria hispida]